MKKLTKAEQMLLSIDSSDYIMYRCDSHGLYQIRKDLPESVHVCPYCKSTNPEFIGE